MAVIAFIGLGHMGAPMAGNLVRAGHEVRGFDLDAAALDRAASRYGVTRAPSLEAALDGAEAAVTVLPAAQHARSAYLDPGGIVACAAPGTVLVDCSTIGTDAARDLHRAAAEAGCAFVDAPVSGGTHGAEAGTLTVMCGGEPDAVAAARPYLEPMAATVLPTGGPGTGQAAKVVNNMLLFINLAGVAEGVALAQRLGLDPRLLHEIAVVSSGDSWALRNWYPVAGVVDSAPSNDDFAARFPADGAVKDVHLAVAAGADVGLPLQMARQAEAMYRALGDAGHGHLDCSAVLKVADGSVDVPTS